MAMMERCVSASVNFDSEIKQSKSFCISKKFETQND